MALQSQLADPSLLIGRNFINGSWTDSESGRRFDVFDPSSGSLIGSCPESTVNDAGQAIEAAANALPSWRSQPNRDRSRILRRWYELVMENRDDLAILITWENGKAKPDASGEVISAASFLEWFSEEAVRVYGDVIPAGAAGLRVSVLKEPVGVCGLITPWNFPAGMVTRKLGPALAAGCTVVLKTAGETPFTANALVALAKRAGIPQGVINVVTALENTPQIGEVFCASGIIRKISFTGSTRVGRLLMRQCSDSVKKLSLELGGNAPFIVFDEADLDLAVRNVILTKFKVSGQTCVSANRIFVQDGAHDEFVRKMVAAVKDFKVGPGLDPNVTHGPLISVAAVDRIDEVVTDAVSAGAQVMIGGKRLPKLGSHFYEPTVLTNVNQEMLVCQTEIFGPVAPILRFSSEQEVLEHANNSDAGLASYVFTKDLHRATRMSEKLHFGMVSLNTGVIPDAASPFGGIKHSGLGREGSKYGIEDYLQLKTVVSGGHSVIH
ncbi:unnamed protein product [Clonostachys solani]|uniref:succinate-semialdehyde dehydrogenase [NAD(P)(+)] n=1 Tax=Clonostachys solani TaxID=160281 RepID=A0A9P0ESH6_9HYPO|nr:unnamed protein product [Clonostachys solani]